MGGHVTFPSCTRWKYLVGWKRLLEKLRQVGHRNCFFSLQTWNPTENERLEGKWKRGYVKGLLQNQSDCVTETWNGFFLFRGKPSLYPLQARLLIQVETPFPIPIPIHGR